MESYQRLIDVIALENLQMRAEYWVLTQVLVLSTLWQITAVLAALLVARILSRLPKAWLARRIAGLHMSNRFALGILAAALSILGPLVALILVLAEIFVARSFAWPSLLLSMTANLLVAWIFIRLLSSLIQSSFWSRAIAVPAFAVATLNIVGLLEPTIVQLDRLGVQLGSVHLSILDVLKGVIELVVLLWAAVVTARLLDTRVQHMQGLTPSLRVLTGKLLRFSLIALALVVVLSSLGIDLTAFALFTGALGVGLGFGMQKSISNLISGLLLLFDRSIKPGDVIELSDPNNRTVQLFGWVTALNARYVSLTTRDGTEWLVPNDELISQRIVNWSYTHNRLRLLTPIAISFDSDVPLAMKIVVDVASATPRVLTDPAPVCRLMSFGESCVNLEMRFWIEDPSNGIVNVRSDVLVAIWREFRKHDIRTPQGHRDLFIRDDSELTVTLKSAAGESAA